MIEALSFLGPRGPVAHEEQSRIFYDSIMLLAFVLARSRREHTCSWR